MRGGTSTRAIVAFLTAWGLGAGAQAMTLEEAFATAYETNPRLISARARLRATDETVTQARAGLRPRVTATTEYGYDWSNSARGESQGDPFSAQLNADQPLYDGGATANNVRASIAEVSAARAELESLEQQVLFDVVTAYLDIQRDQEFVRLAENNVRVIAEQLRASEDRFEVGEVTRTDVSQARARLAEARANLASSQGALETSRQNFVEVVGAQPLNLAPPPPVPELPSSLDDAVTIALESHPLILAARFSENAAERRIRAEIGGLLPQVNLRGSVGYNDNDVFGDPDGLTSVNEQTSASARVQVEIPLYQGGAQYSRVRQAQASASEARADITAEARDRRRIVENAWTELLVSRANIRSVREQVEAQRLAFEGVREEAIVGSRTTLDVLDAEQELLQARVRLVESRRDEYVAAFGLLAAIGDLTMAELGVETVAYDPDEAYDRNNARWFGYERTEDTEWEEIWRP